MITMMSNILSICELNIGPTAALGYLNAKTNNFLILVFSDVYMILI